MENTNIIGKRISDLCSVYSIKSDDLLIISYRLDDPNQVLYKSKKITFGDFTKKFEADIEKYIKSISSELSTRVEELFIHIDSVSSQVVFEIGKIKDTAISDITTISSEVTEKVKDLSGSVQEMSSIVEYAKSELWKCAALSTLNYFTFIGDDISKLPEVSGHLSSVSSDILWFQTEDDDTLNYPRNIQRLDNFQYQLYRMNLQLNDINKIVTTGIVPGQVECNHKDELVQMSKNLEIPEEFKKSRTLEQINIYGSENCQNGTKYYTIFTPAGFEYSLSTTIKWMIENPDDFNSPTSKTLSCIQDEYHEGDIKGLYYIDTTKIEDYEEQKKLSSTYDIDYFLITESSDNDSDNWKYTLNKEIANITKPETYVSSDVYTGFYITSNNKKQNNFNQAVLNRHAYGQKCQLILSSIRIEDWYATDTIDYSIPIVESGLKEVHGHDGMYYMYKYLNRMFETAISNGNAYDIGFHKILSNDVIDQDFTKWKFTDSSQYAMIPAMYRIKSNITEDEKIQMVTLSTAYDTSFNLITMQTSSESIFYYTTDSQYTLSSKLSSIQDVFQNQEDFETASENLHVYNSDLELVRNRFSWKFTDLSDYAQYNSYQQISEHEGFYVVDENKTNSLYEAEQRNHVFDDNLSCIVSKRTYSQWYLTNSEQYAEILTPAEYLISSHEGIDYYVIKNFESEQKVSRLSSYIRQKQVYSKDFNMVFNMYSWCFTDNVEYAERLGTIRSYLSCVLIPYDSQSYISSVVYETNIVAAIARNDEPIEYKSDQRVINQSIANLNDCENDKINVKISTDYVDYEFSDEPIQMEDYKTLTLCQEKVEDPYAVKILGSDYCCSSTYYCCKFNENTPRLPVVVDVEWDILKNTQYGLSTVSYLSFPIYDDKGEERSDASCVVSIINRNDNVCFLDFKFTNCGFSDVENQKLSIQVVSKYDNTLSCVRELSVGGIKPDTENIEPTVNAVCAKRDTTENFAKKVDSLYPSEILYYTDLNKLGVYGGPDVGFITVGAGGGGGITSSDLSIVAEYPFEKLTLSRENKKYSIKVDDNGKLKTSYNDNGQTLIPKIDSNQIYVSWLLQIGRVFCGGDNTGKTDCAASHNFIELTNASTQDINLDDIYIMYRSYSDKEKHLIVDGTKWEYLKLNGVIKSGGTYTIRGAQCNSGKNTLIKVDDFDIEWRRRTNKDPQIDDENFSRSGELIKFSQYDSAFYLVISKSGVQEQLNDTTSTNNVWNSSGTPYGYIDYCSFSQNTDSKYKGEGDTMITPLDKNNNAIDNWNDILFTKWFIHDPSKQGNKAYADRKTSTLWTYVIMSRQNEISPSDNHINYYYNDNMKISNTPGNSTGNHDFFSNKSHFRKDIPNIPTITFGIQATETLDQNGDGKRDASRCFNWVSIGYHDEYIRYRRIKDRNGIEVSEDWSECIYSITGSSSYKDSEGKEWIEPFHDHYDRFRWTASDGTLVTTHKVILHKCLTSGTYEYVIGRSEDTNYKSEYLYFTVRDDNQVKNFSFIQTTDQQGFNWQEYQAWKKSCFAINRNEGDFHFTLNTGDIAQSGNRVSEWIDYHNGRIFIRDKEDMFTIGNNDLCGSPDYELTDGNDNTSKFNLVNILRYFTFELDPNNKTTQTEISYTYSEIPDNETVSGKDYYLYTKTGEYRISCVIEYVYDESIQEYRKAEQGETPTHFYDSGVKYYGKEDEIKYYKIKNETTSETLNYYAEYAQGGTRSRKYPLYSLYSFNYGKWHFISLVSEIRSHYAITFFNQSSMPFSMKLNAAVERWFKKDLQIFKGEDPEKLKDCSDCIVYMHEMPFTIQTMDNFKSPTLSRSTGGCKLNDENNYGKYRFSRLFRKYGIRLVMGGHKHTFSISKPIYDAPVLSDYIIDGTNKFENDSYLSTDDFMSCDVDDKLSRIPVIEVLKGSGDDYFKSDLSSACRFVEVDKITAPVYIMSQATGYKLVSNKELPSPLPGENYGYNTPWLLSYYPASYDTKKNTVKENIRQHRPMFVKYTLDSNDAVISIETKQVDNIYNIYDNGGKAAQSYDINNQLSTELSTVSMAFYNKDSVLRNPTVSTISTSLSDMVDIEGNIYRIKCSFN